MTGLITKMEFGSIKNATNPSFPGKGEARYVELQIWAEDVPDGDDRAIKFGYEITAGMAMDPQETTGYIFATYEEVKEAGISAAKKWMSI